MARRDPPRTPASAATLDDPEASVAGPAGAPRTGPEPTLSTGGGSGPAAPVVLQTAAPDRPLAVGDDLGGRYRLLAALGAGAMGKVFLALDRMVQERVAIKFLSAKHPSPHKLERFRRELLAARRVAHRGYGTAGRRLRTALFLPVRLAT